MLMYAICFLLTFHCTADCCFITKNEDLLSFSESLGSSEIVKRSGKFAEFITMQQQQWVAGCS